MANEPRKRRSTLALLGAAALATVGCDDTTTNLPPADAADAQQSVQDVWNLLPVTAELESEALQRMAVDPSVGDGAALLLDAGELAVEADAMLMSAESSDVARLDAAVDSMATEGFFSTFSDAEVDAVIADVETALGRLEGDLSTTADAEVRQRLRHARDRLARARDARARADRGQALRWAVWAGESLRWLDPERKARALVAAANTLLARAFEVAGDDPEDPILRALDAAQTFCTNAGEALESEQWRVAIVEARLCARISRAVIVRLGSGIDPEVLAERAEEAIAHAASVFERVSEVAGLEPDARVAELLASAEDHLGRAEVAFDEERYRAAIGLAAESTAYSLRALRLLRDDIADPLELRATAAVEVALALSARVAERITDDTPAAIVEAAARADNLLAEAQEAFEGEAWREAWKLARNAILIFTRVLVALA